MIKIRKAGERGHAEHGWLDSWHTFSFADYYDPEQMGFRSLRVINDDTVAGGGGFGMHPHRDMEIISYVLQGALRHQDSLGNSAVMKAGEVQRISAGKGVLHSEFNDSPRDPVHFLQIWIQPDQRGAQPSYAERSFADASPGAWHLIASKNGKEQSLPINQDADVWLAKLTGQETLNHQFAAGRGGWLQVAEGAVQLNGETLTAGDGAAVTQETQIKVAATGQPAQVLLFDLGA